MGNGPRSGKSRCRRRSTPRCWRPRRRRKATAPCTTGRSRAPPRCSRTSTRKCRATSANSASSWECDMARLSMVEAIRDAMDCKMAEDERVVVFGEDVGYFGGVFRCTEGLQRKYGKSRCFDAPINESGIVAVAIGMGAYGLRPVAEIQFAD